MKTSIELLAVAGIVPRLKLGIKKAKGGMTSTGVHRVKLISDKIIKAKDFTGKEVEFVEYTLEENGEKKVYKTKLKNGEGKLAYLVQNLAGFKEDEEVFMEMKKAGMKNYVDVWSVNEPKRAEVEDEDEETSYNTEPEL